MRSWLASRSFALQLAIVCVASLAVVALAGLLIRDVLVFTEARLLAEALRQSNAACRELTSQYRERTAWVGDPLEKLPQPAQDLSLRGLAATVLRSYEGMEGGFYSRRANRVLGHTDWRGVPPRLGVQELQLVASAAARAGGGFAEVTGARDRDIVVVVAGGLERGDMAAWVLKRVAGARDPAGGGRRLFYVGLALSALLGTGTIVWLWLALRRGVEQISLGLQRLEENFDYRLPDVAGEFGAIARAINRMADRRKALEAELRRQDRLAALGKVVAGVAHEIRNPLNALRLTLELLSRRAKRGAVSGEEIQATMREIDRLDAILARLLAFGRPHLEDRKPQLLRPLMEHAVGLVQEQAQRKGIEILLEADPPEISADVDGMQIVQVLLNLLLNAIEASPVNGRVEVKARLAEPWALVCVRDYGPGIAEDVLPHIFDAFFSTRPEGSGLGLSVSREIVAAHGGSLEYDPGGPGTTFRLTLPVARSAV